jgi:hypothetical protein
MLHKNITDEKASFVTVVLNLASVYSKDVEYCTVCRLCAAVLLAGKQQRAYCQMCAGVAGFVLV